MIKNSQNIFLNPTLDLRDMSPRFSNFKEIVSYTFINTPPPPLNNVPTKGFS